jgi:hypothetical protein
MAVAAVLIVLGSLAFAYGGVVRRSHATWTPILGALTLVSGLAVGFVATETAYRAPTPAR